MKNDQEIPGWARYTCPHCGYHCSIYYQPGGAAPTIQDACATKIEMRRVRDENIRRKARLRIAGKDDTLPGHNHGNPRMRRGKS